MSQEFSPDRSIPKELQGPNFFSVLIREDLRSGQKSVMGESGDKREWVDPWEIAAERSMKDEGALTLVEGSVTGISDAAIAKLDKVFPGGFHFAGMTLSTRSLMNAIVADRQ